MAIERLAPDNLLLQNNLAGALSAVTDDPDSPDATFLTAPALQSAAAINYYLLDAAQAGAGDHGQMQQNGTAPAQLTMATRWNVGQLAPTRYASMDRGASVARTATDATFGWTTTAITANPSSTRGDAYRIPTPLSGSFASANWTMSFAVRSTSGTAQRGRLRFRVLRSTDAALNGAGATEVVTWTETAATTTASTTADSVVSITFNPGAITLNNEYLYVQIVWVITTAGAANAAELAISRGTNTRLTTAAFTPIEPITQARVSFPPPTENPTLGAGLQEFRVLVRRKGAGSPTATLALYENGVLIATLGSPTAVTNNTGQVVSGAFDATGRAPASIEADVLGTGVAGGSVEVGAIEYNANTTPYIIGGGFVPSRQALFGGSLDVPIYNTDVRVSFPTPVETLVAAEAAQEFRVLVRKKGSGSNPSITIYLYENGSQVGSALLGPIAVSNTSGVVLSATWNASILSGGLAGMNVECRVVGTGASGGTLEVGAIEWNALAFTPQITHEPLNRTPELYGGSLSGPPITLSGGFVPSRQALFGGTVLSGVIQGGFIGGRMTADSRIMAFRQPPPKNRAVLFGGALTESAGGSNRARVTPNQLISLTNLSGTLADIQDDPDSPDNSFLTI